MKLYTKQDLIDLVESLKNYTHESHSILGHDEREAKEFVDIFLKDRNPIELPSEEKKYTKEQVKKAIIWGINLGYVEPEETAVNRYIEMYL